MKFRRLYWVTEQVDEQGMSEIAGVFTSIPDLVEEGIHWYDDIEKRNGFRLTLVKLDSKQRPLGVWASPDYGNLSEDLKEYVNTQEFSVSEVESLLDALRKFPVGV